MSANSIPISVIILTHRNDARFLKALKSAQFAQEVLIIDHQSHNNWSELQRQYRFKVISIKGLIRDFSQVRNLGLAKAAYTWVFFLDSDEFIPVSSQAHINKVIQDNQASGVRVRRLDIFLGQPIYHGEPGHTYLLRMGKKQLMKFVRPIHEIATMAGNITHSSIVIHHFAHPSIEQFIDKVASYSLMEAEYQLSQKRRFSIFELCVYPCAKFVSNYWLKAGFLDGWRGLIYAMVMSIHSLAVRVFIYEQQQ